VRPPGPLLVIGESLVDLIEERDGDAVSYHPRLGGSPLNVAVGAARLGVDVTLATALGSDRFGEQLRDFLRAEAVTVHDQASAQRHTCLAVASTHQGHVTYEYFGDPRSMMDIPSIDESLVVESLVVHAGSTAFFGDPVLGSVMEAYGRATGFKTMDPNPRPFLIEDPDAFRAGIALAFASVDLVKLSAEDVTFLFPGLSPMEAAREISGTGCSTVMITAADKPAIVMSGGEVRTVDVPHIVAIDPTGAGDSFMASVLRDVWRLGPPKDVDGWVEIARTAVTAASMTCSSMGGAASMPTSGQLGRGL
jgi:fructokinase